MKKLLMLLGVLLFAMPVAAQTVRTERLTLTLAPCTVSSGTAAPEGAVVGKVCDWYFQSDATLWRKISGTGNTGWSAAATGTVTSVTITVPSLMTATGCVITTSGTCAITWAGTNTRIPYFDSGGALATAADLTVTGIGSNAMVNVRSATSDASVGVYATTGSSGGFMRAYPSGFAVASLASKFGFGPDGSTGLVIWGDAAGSGGSGSISLRGHGYDSAAEQLLLNATGVHLTGHFLPSVTYASNLGSDAKKFLTLHAAELWVETLVAQNTIATIGGRVIVAPTNILTADLASGGTTITLKYNNFANGDRVVMQSDGKLEWMAIASAAGGGAGAYTYTVTRDLDASGANNWTSGDAIVNTGTTGDGYLDLYSDGALIPGTTVGPTIVGNVRTGTTWNNIAARWAIGNLNGLYGYASDTYGTAFGDESNSNLTVDGTNGIRFRNSTTTFGSLTSSTWTLGQVAAGQSNVYITSGAIELRNNTTARVRLAADGSGYLANTAIAWDTSGNMTMTAATIGGWTVAATSISATNIVLTSGAANIANILVGTGANAGGLNSANAAGDITIWSGSNYAGRATAPFRVTAAGALTATNATITGTITATAGTIGGCTIASTSITCGSGFSVSSAGVIAGTSGTIGGFDLGSDYIRDTGNSFGMASTVTGGTDVRFWAGETFANRATAEFSVDEAGYLRSTAATFGGGSSGVDVDSTGLIVNGGAGRVRAGSAELNVDGLVFYTGTEGNGTRVKWDASGNYIAGAGGYIRLKNSAGIVAFDDAGGGFFGPDTDAIALGRSGDEWGELWAFLSSTTSSETPVVRQTDGHFKYKTDGMGNSSCTAGQFVNDVSAESGIIISVACAAPFSLEITTLRKELDELRSLVAALVSRDLMPMERRR